MRPNVSAQAARLIAMLSSMQDIPLSITRILTYGASVHGTTPVTTWHGERTAESADSRTSAGAFSGSGPHPSANAVPMSSSSFATDADDPDTQADQRAEQTDFATIGARAAAFAHVLHDELGVTGDERVGSFLYNCAEHLEVMFAAACKGAVFTPLNKQLMNDQIRHIINHAEIKVIVADPRMAAQLAEVLEGVTCVDAVVFVGPRSGSVKRVRALFDASVAVHSYEELLDGRSTVYEWPELDERTAAALCYSTGTTGAPKGVLYSHRSIYLEAMLLRSSDSLAITHGEPFLCCIPIYHVLSWGVPFAAFMTGTPLILPDADVSAPTLAQLIETTHPRVAHGVPTIWLQLIVYYLKHPPSRMSLTEIYAGGSPVPPRLIKVWEEQYGVDVVHVWGMVETSTAGTVARPPRGASGDARWAYRVSQGRFPSSLEYRVVNDGQVVAPTDRYAGEIQVRGNLVTGSYYHSPTSEAGGAASQFRGKPTEDATNKFTSDGWLRTGDVGSVTEDGFLTVEDRARDVIRSGGEWIYSVQLENLIMANDEVVEAAVIGYPDERWVERPLAVTVLRDGVSGTIETAELLRERMRDELPSWMLPEYWTFVKFIDKTSVGKFDKKDLRGHLAAGDYNIIRLAGPGEGQRDDDSALLEYDD